MTEYGFILNVKDEKWREKTSAPCLCCVGSVDRDYAYVRIV